MTVKELREALAALDLPDEGGVFPSLEGEDVSDHLTFYISGVRRSGDDLAVVVVAADAAEYFDDAEEEEDEDDAG